MARKFIPVGDAPSAVFAKVEAAIQSLPPLALGDEFTARGMRFKVTRVEFSAGRWSVEAKAEDSDHGT